MFESSKFVKSGLKSGGHIRPGPDLAGFEKNGRIPAGAGAGYDIRCNPSNKAESKIFARHKPPSRGRRTAKI